MPGMGLSRLGLGFHRRASGSGGGGTAAYQQLLDEATAKSWTGLYDPTNPDTRTLRSDGGNDFISALADGLGNLNDLTQSTGADQPQHTVGQFGQLDSGLYSVGAFLQATGVALSSPFSYVFAVKLQTAPSSRARVINYGTSLGNFDVKNTSPHVWQIFAGTVLNASETADTNAHINDAYFDDGTASLIVVDDTQVASGDAGTSSSTSKLTLAALDDGTGGGVAKHIGPVAILNEDDATKRQAMRDLMHDLTGIAKA